MNCQKMEIESVNEDQPLQIRRQKSVDITGQSFQRTAALSMEPGQQLREISGQQLCRLDNSRPSVSNTSCTSGFVDDTTMISNWTSTTDYDDGFGSLMSPPVSFISPPDQSLDHRHRNQSSSWIRIFKEWSLDMKREAFDELVSNCNGDDRRLLRAIIEPYFQVDFISKLPMEISLMIMQFLDSKDLVLVSHVSKRWQRIAEDNLTWEMQCKSAGLGEESYPELLLSGSCSVTQRAPCKAIYLRHCRIQRNWRRSETVNGDSGIRGHDGHVITCLLMDSSKIVTGSDDCTLRIWCLKTGNCLNHLVGHTGGVWCAVLTDDGKQIISGATDRTIRVWDAETGECIWVFHGHVSTIRCLAVKKDIFVSGSRDATLQVWDLTSGLRLHHLSGHSGAVRCVEFDGRRIVSGSYDGSVKVWDAITGRCTHTLLGHTHRVYSIQFDSDEDIVVSGSLDTTIRVWSLKRIGSGQCLRVLNGHRSLTSGMQLRGKILVTGNADSTIKIWDIKNGQCLHTLNGHSAAVTSIDFMENGMIVSSSDDGTVKLWDVKSGKLIRDVVALRTRASGGCVWRLKANRTKLACAVGSRSGTLGTQLLLLDFDDKSEIGSSSLTQSSIS